MNAKSEHLSDGVKKQRSETLTMNTDYLADFDVQEQAKRAIFMNHMYKCSGRTNGLYTGLWQEFCLNEAGPYCKEMWLQQQEAIRQFIEHTELRKLETLDLVNCDQDHEHTEECREQFIPTFSD